MLVGDEARGTWKTPAQVRAAFFDIDGTLAPQGSGELPASARAAIVRMRKRGIRAFVATGRAPDYALQFARGLFDGVLAMNGMYVMLGDEVIFKRPLPRDVVERLVGMTDAGMQVAFSEATCAYTNGADRHVPANENLASWFDVGATSQALNHEVYQASFMLDPADEDEMRGRFPGCDISRWHPRFVDLFAQGGGKAAGIAEVLRHLGVRASESVAFGDSPNDISMFEACGVSVAMASGFDETRAAARYVTEPPENDGIYNACVRLGMI